MSTDIQLTHRCSHETLEERVFLSADRRSLPTRQPVASSSSVRITANDELTIPSFGLHSQAQLTSSRSGPFKIVRNETDLIIRSKTASVSLTLPINNRLPTSQVVRLLNTEFSGKDLVVENENGHLLIAELGSMGRQSEIVVEGKAAGALGFVRQKRALGRQIFPGWGLAQRSDPSIKNLFPKFNAPIRQNPYFKVSYTQPLSRCLRCGATGVENDWRSDSQGEVILLENENLLHQVALKILLTTKGSNPFHEWYGTTLRSRIGAKAIGAVASLINEDVRRALEIVQRQQNQQRRYQPVSPKERLATIESVQTFPSREDPTSFLIDAYVRNASQDPINLSVIFSVPGTAAFVNDTRVF